jgi:hypothetical protein
MPLYRSAEFGWVYVAYRHRRGLAGFLFAIRDSGDEWVGFTASVPLAPLSP